ncbi:MAG: single-stranded DNA-binding protein [Clostridia bacterium]|nr:single-stranded DNA-binding protein [Clostridia bacterium]
MASFNKVILMGRLTAAPELKQTQSGTAVTSFSLAVDRKYTKAGEQKQTDFITVIAWRQTAEFVCKYFGKGSAMLVCGELQTRSWEDGNGNRRYATEVVASEVTFCEAKRDSEGNNTYANQNATQGKYEPPAYTPDSYTQPSFEEIKDDGDLPF